ncbi:uncharacterized protein [Clytia hemisphaerica]|uniref:uncharacterized protein n=1 Tax=Clytia hemisphaerica TaxID=252671 RepID=UPI0034D46132
MWRLIKSLNGTPETNSPNEAMKDNGKTITSNERKAEIFAKHYASVSRHKFTKEERDVNRECKKKLRATRDDRDWVPFTIPELEQLPKQQNRKSANERKTRQSCIYATRPIQGSVLSPILFLFYINNLAKIVPQEATNSLFADVVTLLATANTLKEAKEICQRSVDVVVKWSKEWKISLNSGKSESSLFSNSTRETAKNWTPYIKIENNTINTLPGIENKLVDGQLILEAASTQIRSFNPTRTIYTDGSATSGTTDGGAGVVLTTDDPEDIRQTRILRIKGAKFTSSYEEEVCAMERAAEWIAENAKEEDVIVIGTDSQSLCQALAQRNWEVDYIRHKLSQSKAKTIIQWLPGHCNIPSNEAADKVAKEATKIKGAHRPTSMNCAPTVVKTTIKDGDPERPWLKEVYSKYSNTKEKSLKTRRDQVVLARIRYGKHLAFAAYDHQIHEKVDPKCPRCDHARHDLEHWFLECPATRVTRLEIFGEESEEGLSLLTRRPEQSITLARRTLLGVRDE